MKIGIIEDEPIAAQYLGKLLKEIDKDIEIVFELKSIKEVIDELLKLPDVDLIFSDIELVDGPVFTAFDVSEIPCPVIFATAYEQYAIDAFESNGIGYILKPYDKVAIAKAIDKFKKLTQKTASIDSQVLSLLHEKLLSPKPSDYKKRFVIKRQSKIELLSVTDIAYFRLELSGLTAFDFSNKPFPLSELNLSSLESVINPNQFFRLNRHEIVSIHAIESMEALGKDRIVINVPNRHKQLICSAGRTPQFKKWIEQV